MMTTETRTARETFDGGRLADLDAALAKHGRDSVRRDGTVTPRNGAKWNGNTGTYVIPGEYEAWQAEGEQIARHLAEAEATARGVVCGKCNGRGRLVRFNHRSAGLCYTCNGDGWTAKGRKLHAKGQA